MMSQEVTAIDNGRKNIILGLNPALQRSITLAGDLIPGSVNRGQNVHIGIGGKGQNVYCGAISMQVTELPYIAQFIGLGPEGDLLLSMLKSKSTNQVSRLHDPLKLLVRSEARLRNAITLIDASTGSATEVVEPSGIITPDEILLMTKMFEEQFQTSKVDGVAVMGSFPPGCPSNYYSQLLQLCIDENTWVVLDIVSQVLPTVAAVRKRAICPIMLKVNARELFTIAGISVDTQVRESAEAADSKLIQQACESLFRQLQFDGVGTNDIFVAVTDGPHSGHLIQAAAAAGTSGESSTLKVHLKYALPALPGTVINPIGAGDAVSSGTLMAVTNRVTPVTDGGALKPLTVSIADISLTAATMSFRWGLACGAASCLSPLNSFVDFVVASEIFAGITVDNVSLLP